MLSDIQVRARAELKKRQILEVEGIETQYQKFIKSYASDPAQFVLDCIRFPEGARADPYQLNILSDLAEHKRVCVRSPHGAGKDLDISTVLPTPDGWTTMGEVKAGDIVLNEEGKPVEVIYAEEPKWRDAYEVSFADGTSIIAGAGHLWTAIDVYNRPKGFRIRDWREHWDCAKTLETHVMAKKVKTRGGQLRWRVPAAKPLDLPEADLPIDPYLLGAWLGDGSCSGGRITCSEEDINDLEEMISASGYETKTHRYKGKGCVLRIYGLTAMLRELGVLDNKHIPMAYLRASEKQRRELLAGLMDTDGYKTRRNTDGICLRNERLAKDVLELIRTLGLVVRIAVSDAKIYGRVVGKRWRMNARFDECPFRYSRKRNGWAPRDRQSSRHTQRTVTSVEPVGKRLTKCISVDSPRHLFLAGEAMIPTHNSAVTSWAILWFALTRDGMEGDWKIPTTASTWRQLIKFLWPEIHKWSFRLDWDIIGRRAFNADELLARSIQLDRGEAFASASSTPEFIEGVHADHVLYIFDESKAIPDGIWDSAEGAFSTGDAYWLACSTPGEQKGRFWQIQSRAPGYEDWHTRQITLEDFLSTGRVNEEWVNSRKRQWGESSVVYQNRVLGNFASDDTMGVIPLSWVELAVERWYNWQDQGGHGVVTSIGVDVAGGKTGADKNTVAVCYDGSRIGQIIHFMPKDPDEATMELVNFLAPLMDRFPTATLVIDTIGIGAGVAHRLRELHYSAIGFVSNAKVDVRDQTGVLEFYNWRSAAWWLMREILDPSNGFETCLPPDDGQTPLLSDLTVPHYQRRANGKIWIENKEVLRRADRLGRSPDDADAVIYAVCGPTLHELTMSEEVTQVTYRPPNFGDW